MDTARQSQTHRQRPVSQFTNVAAQFLVTLARIALR